MRVLVERTAMATLIGLMACSDNQSSQGSTGGSSGTEGDAGAGMGGESGSLSGGMGASTGGGGGGGGGVTEPNMTLEVCGTGATTSLGACIEGDDADGGVLSDADYSEVAAQFRGTLEAVSRERVACESRGLGSTRSDAFALELRHEDGRLLRLILDLPLDVELAEPDAELDLTYERKPWGSFHEGPPPLGSLELRSTEGELVLWIGQSGQGPEMLEPPDEISLSQGTVQCRDRLSSCSPTHNSLHVRAGGDDVEVAPRVATPVGDYLVWLQQNEQDFGCSGGHPLLVAVARNP